MQMFAIEGGIPLQGTIDVGGSKNAVLPMMAAALLCEGPVRLCRVPRLVDVDTMATLLRDLGAQTEFAPDNSLTIVADQLHSTTAPYDVVRRMRASVCVLGPLLARFGRARVSLPGGCNIGLRPIDIHLRGLSQMGASIRMESGYVIAECDRLHPAEIDLAGPSGTTVTGTANLMMAAAATPGTTVLRNAALEPEIVELGRLLQAAGAEIEGTGCPTVTIRGRKSLRVTEAITVVPDRIEASTMAIAAAVTRGTITIRNCPVPQMTSVIQALRDIGATCQCSEDELTVTGTNPMKATDLVASPYPGLPTDVQAQFMALLATVRGTSHITDSVFPDRFIHAAELVRMGALIQVNSGTATIQGVSRLSGASVMASDLRASAALVLGALAAEGTSQILRVYHLDRGYAAFDEKLHRLGARIRRVDDRDVPVDVPAEVPAPLTDQNAAHAPRITNPAATIQESLRGPHASASKKMRAPN